MEIAGHYLSLDKILHEWYRAWWRHKMKTKTMNERLCQVGQLSVVCPRYYVHGFDWLWLLRKRRDGELLTDFMNEQRDAIKTWMKATRITKWGLVSIAHSSSSMWIIDVKAGLLLPYSWLNALLAAALETNYEDCEWRYHSSLYFQFWVESESHVVVSVAMTVGCTLWAICS